MLAFAHAFFIGCLLFAGWYQFVHIGLRQLSTSSLLLTLLLIIHGVPMLVFLHLTGPDTVTFEAALSAVNREEVQANVLMALGTMFTLLVIGMELANVVFRRSLQQGRRALSESGDRPALSRQIYRSTTYTRLVLVGVALWMLAIMLANDVPGKTLEYFRSEGLEIDKVLLRREGGGVDNYFYNIALYSVAPFLCAIAMTIAARKSALLADKAIAVFLFGVVLLGKFGTLSKAPPVVLILQLLLLWFLASGRRLSLRVVVFGVVLTTAMFGLMAHAVVPELDFGATLAFLYYRIFDITNQGLIEYFAAYPASLPHGWGTGYLAMFGHAQPKLETYFAVAELTRQDVGFTSASNSLFVADAWAEYAWIGVVFTSLAAGFLTRVIDIYAFRHGRTDEAVCVVAACSFGVFTMLSTAFSTALFTGGLAIVPLVSMLLVRRRRRRLPGPTLQDEIA